MMASWRDNGSVTPVAGQLTDGVNEFLNRGHGLEDVAASGGGGSAQCRNWRLLRAWLAHSRNSISCRRRAVNVRFAFMYP
ncbi:hypothetical protein EVAR_49933_1 [Eumeta japonica]|uniref:Uncharacterized protein n=1 Tax=Eumeta variegata TaxID=151549 RepID=A0A4C1XTV5_EUMVA|nr:hypothetical protein EVAR_49933_1 [Eumeta japonica]